MRKFLFFILAIGLVSCGQEDSPLAKKIVERDSLLKVMDELGEKVKSLNLEISELDTSISANKRKIYVNTMALKRDTFVHYLQVQGVVEADKNILISPETSGMIKQIMVEEGQTVSKGQTILVLDNEIIMKGIEELKTQLSLAEEIFKRQENLWNQKIGSEMQYLEAKTRKEALEKSLKTAQAQLDKAIVKAPETGIVDELFSKIGEMASPMQPVVRIVNLEKVYIKADVSENYLNQLKKGQKVNVFFPSLNEEFTAVIGMTGNFINPGNRTFKMQANLVNRDGILKPNLLGTILIRNFEMPDAVIVPDDYILSSAGGQQYVYTAKEENGKTFAQKVLVKTGASYGGKTLIEQGLKGDEMLITEGARTVTNGEMVIIKNQEQPPF